MINLIWSFYLPEFGRYSPAQKYSVTRLAFAGAMLSNRPRDAESARRRFFLITPDVQRESVGLLQGWPF
jgi:hypothetical protein